MEFKNLHIEDKDTIRVITVNRPEKMNALNVDTVAELSEAFNQIGENKKIQAVVITGAGEKSFVAGADIAEIKELNEKSGEDFSRNGSKVFRLIEKMRIPVIAAVNGFALGGGCELAMACHLRIASSKAKFGQPEINLGIIPGYGGTQRLPRLVGRTNALFYLLSGEMIDAQKALKLGLVNEVVEPERLMVRAEEIAKLMAGKAPLASAFILQAVDQGINDNIDTALEIESAHFGKICGTDDMKEGTKAFMEKRKPAFKGK